MNTAVAAALYELHSMLEWIPQDVMEIDAS